MLFTFLLIVQTLIATMLVVVILMQRSEGGGLGVGGSSAGLMTARGAADFLTRATAVLGGIFIVLCIFMAAYAGASRQAPIVDTTLARPVGQQEAPAVPTPQAPAAPTGNETAPAVPLAQ